MANDILNNNRRGERKLKLDVIFRSCSTVYAVHGNRRIVNAPKSEIILRCLNSLIRSMHLAATPESERLSLTVIDDHSDPECVTVIKKLLAACAFPTSFIAMKTTGNGQSLLCNYEHAKENCTDLIYFVEDDYLHGSESVKEMIGAYRQISAFLRHDLVLAPCDNADLYQRIKPSGVLLGEHRYWRNIDRTTATIMLSKQTLMEHWEKYMGITRYGLDPEISESNTINLVYESVPCFSPMPTLAVHLADTGAISPFVDWIKWWQQNEVTGRRVENPDLFREPDLKQDSSPAP
jgi:hypothetical protein